MSYSELEAALAAVGVPVYKVQAPEKGPDGKDLNRFVVWTPTGTRRVYAAGVPFATIYQAKVTIATQTENDDLPGLTREALAKARIPMGVDEQMYDEEQATYFTDVSVEVM